MYPIGVMIALRQHSPPQRGPSRTSRTGLWASHRSPHRINVACAHCLDGLLVQQPRPGMHSVCLSNSTGQMPLWRFSPAPQATQGFRRQHGRRWSRPRASVCLPVASGRRADSACSRGLPRCVDPCWRARKVCWPFWAGAAASFVRETNGSSVRFPGLSPVGRYRPPPPKKKLCLVLFGTQNRTLVPNWQPITGSHGRWDAGSLVGCQCPRVSGVVESSPWASQGGGAWLGA
jgi:hypothetical protein